MVLHNLLSQAKAVNQEQLLSDCFWPAVAGQGAPNALVRSDANSRSSGMQSPRFGTAVGFFARRVRLVPNAKASDRGSFGVRAPSIAWVNRRASAHARPTYDLRSAHAKSFIWESSPMAAE
jgi:hypothetical protein